MVFPECTFMQCDSGKQSIGIPLGVCNPPLQIRQDMFTPEPQILHNFIHHERTGILRFVKFVDIGIAQHVVIPRNVAIPLNQFIIFFSPKHTDNTDIMVDKRLVAFRPARIVQEIVQFPHLSPIPTTDCSRGYIPANQVQHLIFFRCHHVVCSDVPILGGLTQIQFIDKQSQIGRRVEKLFRNQRGLGQPVQKRIITTTQTYKHDNYI
ncbi:unknown [Tannerella sp. CAG:118]|nr:unknown [Tannerella sp. CAG:118]